MHHLDSAPGHRIGTDASAGPPAGPPPWCLCAPCDPRYADADADLDTDLDADLDRVDWQIISQAEPRETGQLGPGNPGEDSASYTKGLVRHAVPELLFWARPTLGEDPGLDWSFGPQERAVMLDDLALRLIRGQIGPGTRWGSQHDGGLTEVDMRVGNVTIARQLSADGLDELTPVIPVRYSLRRPPPGKLTALSESTAALVDDWVRQARRQADVLRARATGVGAKPVTLPREWRLPTGTALGDPVDVATDQPFGPLHWLVVARAGQLITAGPQTLAEFLNSAGSVQAAGYDCDTLLDILTAHARRCGRQDPVLAAAQAADRVQEAITGRSRSTRRWQQAREVLTAGTVERSRWRSLDLDLRSALRGWIAVVLATDVLADVLPEHHLMAGHGPWAWAMSLGNTPGPRWHATKEVLELVRRTLSTVPVAQLRETAAILDSAGSVELTCALQQLHGWCVMGAGSVPPEVDLLPHSPAALQGLGDLARIRRMVTVLVAWCTFADRLSPCCGTVVESLVGHWFRERVRAGGSSKPAPAGRVHRQE